MTRLDDQIAFLRERLDEAEATRRRGYGAGLTDEGHSRLLGELSVLIGAQRASVPDFAKPSEADEFRDLHDTIDPGTASIAIMSANGVVSVNPTSEQLTRFFQMLSDDARKTVTA